ncbi:hypothetical protein [Streptomyces sp. NPDC048603]|uniref:hypothetical protein n=1 Tax=Streptomyces sp. NPDC048603 TaxID=3365577 RepID=UPI00371DF9A9
MPLTNTQWDVVRDWFRDHVFVMGSPQLTLIGLGLDKVFVASVPFGESGAADYEAAALIRAARNRGLATQREVLDALTRVGSLTSLLGDNEMLEQYRAELAAAVELHVSSRDPYLAGVLKNGAEVFIDRLDLRKRLKEFAEDPYRTVLVVDGAPDSGRSHTYNLIRHLGAHNGFRPVRVTLNRTSTADQVVHWLAEYVTDPRTGTSPLNPTQLNDPLPMVQKAVHRIVTQATAAEEQFWFVLDDCDRLDINSDVWDCIGKLAEAVYEYAGDREGVPRLVLLGYSDTMRQLPDEIRNNEVRDTARAVTPDDLRQFFREFFGETPPPDGGPPPDGQRIGALVEAVVPAVLGAAEAPGPDSYMHKVRAAAETAVRLYRTPAPAPAPEGSPAPAAPDGFAARLRERLSAAAGAPEPPPLSDLRIAYREAACLFTHFDPARLRLPGEEEPTGRAVTELVDDCQGGGNLATVSWTLKPDVRDLTLRSLPGPAPARFALLANLDQVPPGPGIERTALAYLSGALPDLPRQGADELPFTLQTVLWLAQIKGLKRIPDAPTVQRLLERARLLQPLRRLVQDPFQGRAAELAVLRGYIGIPTDLPPPPVAPPEGDGPGGGPVPADGGAPGAGSGPTPPLVLHGPGGMGKSTLLAKFLLDSLQDFPSGFPFAYIDFERPTLSVHEPATLVAEMARQLGIQYPDHREAYDALARECEETAGTHQAAQTAVEDLGQLSTTRATLGRSSSSGLHRRVSVREAELAGRLATLVVKSVGIPSGEPQPPLVIVIDSFEEAQYRGSPVLGRFWAIWSALQEAHPRLRVLVSGRVLAEHPARVVQPITIELGELDPPASAALLIACGISDHGLAAELAARVGGHPLSLKLAAKAAEQSGDGTASLRQLIDSLPDRRRRFFRAVDQLLVQGTLYERILDRIGDARVRALAEAGLALRSITPELIREVLAVPCGLVVESDDEARALFGLLAREGLVEPAGPGSVRHRGDLRAIMLRLATRARADLMGAVAQRAVAYHSAREGLEDRAEEIYHRLRLNQNPREVEQRWLPGLERYLEGAEQDMAGRSAAYLGGHLVGHTPDEVLREADQEDWERIAAQEVADLLDQGYAEQAATRLAQRRPWTAGSPLHPLWVETLDRLGRRTEARAAAEEALDRAEAAGFPRLRLELLQLSARLAEADGDLAAAAEDLAEAEEVATGLGEGLEALGALFARAHLGSGGADVADTDSGGGTGPGAGGTAGRSAGGATGAGAEAGPGTGTGTGTGAATGAVPDAGADDRLADRLHRLPDADLARQPALVRAAAAEVYRDHPQALERAVDVVGLPPADQRVLLALALAIERAVAEQPGLRDALGALLANAAPQDPRTAAGRTHTHTGIAGRLQDAQRLGTLDELARRLPALDSGSGWLAAGVAAAMSMGSPAGPPPGRAGEISRAVGGTAGTEEERT